MSAIRHRPLGPPAPGDSDEDFSDNESAPLTQDIYGGRFVYIYIILMYNSIIISKKMKTCF